MSSGPRLDLGHPRDLAELLRDALTCFFRYPGTLLLVGLAIVAPVEIIVSGVGLGQLSAPYQDTASRTAGLVSAATGFFVTAPLLTAAVVHLLAQAAAGEQPRAGSSLQAALDAFPRVFAAVLLAGAGVLLGLALLVVPGVYLFVRWYFVSQAVVIESETPVGALRHSSEVVESFWFRTAGIVLLANLLVALVVVVVLIPVEAIAQAADREAVSLAGTIAVETVTVPYVAVLSTLLYHDLRARRAIVG
ncbi:MAG: hypothetical protein WKF29_09580 [Thermoleophilaceae bacterium]